MAKKQAAASGAAVIDTKPITETQKNRQELVVESKTMVVVENAEQCRAAGEFLARVQKTRRWAEGVYKNAKDPLNKALKDLRENEKADIEPLKRIEGKVTTAIQGFREAEEQRRADAILAEQRAREEEARREQQARADELRAAAENAPKRVATQLRQQADIIAAADVVVDPVDIEPEEDLLPDNMHERETYHAAVDSKDALVLQVAAQTMITRYRAPDNVRQWLEALFKPNAQATMNLVQPQMVEVNGLARRMRTDLQLQGVRAVKDTGLVSRG